VTVVQPLMISMSQQNIATVLKTVVTLISNRRNIFSEKRFNHKDCNGYKTVANDFFRKEI
jgi:hypothetical protein